ncbi:AraC family transcriptional regulator [Pedobacter hiemivivus]|uniref:AraC family transcriptional regulator n=1 Tax=Pedobacter hiemivivus TaxID=2530454 RepID=A0A4R0N467_9SPHI|nr:AraC family transcriptional regulator [Pedobacter hiemivivus]TCC94708.1 AraC family transcriptional regulator [Pedobacter hiemivivus]
MNNFLKKEAGFEGEKMISLPPKILKSAMDKCPEFFHLCITHIGYFPKATAHFRERRKGCEDNIFIYCVLGKGYFTIDNKKFEVGTNQFINVPATDKYMRYWADDQDPWTIYWVHFKGERIADFNKSLDITITSGAQKIPFNQQAIDIWNGIYGCLDMGYGLRNLSNANFCLYNFLATFYFPENHMQVKKVEELDMITETIVYMKDNVNRKLRKEDFSKNYSISNSHFAYLFRKKTGMSPIDYFIHLKMQRACQLLHSNNDKIKEICLNLGYEDQYYFSRLFKKNMGISPEHYRLIHKSRVGSHQPISLKPNNESGEN